MMSTKSLIWSNWWRQYNLMFGLVIMALVLLLTIAAPLVGGDPITMNPARRLLPSSSANWLGTDALGRDVMSRTLYGARISLFVGFMVAAVSVLIGLFIGLMSGYFRALDPFIMRVMDGVMAIPGILLAIALVALTGASVWIVVAAITVPEVPRVVRLVRSVVLIAREALYVDAAVSGGTPDHVIVFRHILPNTFAPLTVQSTFICASAILLEASLSFLGAGTPPEIPTWGNMIAQGRLYITRAPLALFSPALALALVVLAINLIGDGLRDHLDPKLARRL